MANSSKKLPQHEQAGATVRVYMDIKKETNEALEMIAQLNGRTKKGHLEFIIAEAEKEYMAREKETNKRAKGKK